MGVFAWTVNVPAEARRLLDGSTALPGGWSEEELGVECLSALWDLLGKLHTELERDLDVRLHDVARSARFSGVHIEGNGFATAHGVQIDIEHAIDERLVGSQDIGGEPRRPETAAAAVAAIVPT